MDHQLIASLTNDELLAATRDLVRRSCSMEADLLVHLGEIDERKLYLDRAFSSMFTFCTRELGFSEGAAYNRILVARAARRAARAHRGRAFGARASRRTAPARTASHAGESRAASRES